MLREVEGVRVEDFVGSLSALPEEVARLRGYGLDTGFDLETTDTDPLNARIVTLAFKPKGKRALVLDVRHLDEGELYSLGDMLGPLFDGSVTLVGHNLKFDLEFVFSQMGLRGHNAYDTMLAEQVILGLGVSSAAEKGIHFSMQDVAERYGLPVHKEERSWFIHLDQRVEGQVKSQVGSHTECPEPYEDGGGWYSPDCYEVPEYAMVGGSRPWDEPLPPEQLSYIRQDVSIVHRIKEAQAPLIEQYGLGEVVSLENRAVFPLAGIETWGVQINREGWLAVIERVKARADELERILHQGVEGQYEGLDLHVLKARQERYLEKWRPYGEWMRARDAFIATRKQEWEEFQVDGGRTSHVFSAGDETFNLNVYKNWSEYKKAVLDWWYEQHGKLARPPANKAGVNLGSWQQVRDGFNDLFQSLGQNVQVTSISEEDLDPLRYLHPLVGIYTEYAHARKIVTVYGTDKGKKKRSFIEMLDERDRLRASYQQIGADTGRMSSHSPNFQQIPSEGIGADLRKNVVAADGHTLVVADFSNIELRIVAELSGDRFLLDAFRSGEDVHAYTAKVMFGLDIPAGENAKKWTSRDAIVGGRVLEGTSYRKIAKTINYALLYGAGVDRLASALSVDVKTAKELHATYYSTFSQAIAWLSEQRSRLDRTARLGKEKVYAETRSGRKRWFDIPKLHLPPYPANGVAASVDAVRMWQQEVEDAKELHRKKMGSIRRQLANTPIQGLSADITKEAAALWYETVGYANDMRLVAVVHDEYLVECALSRVHEAKEVLRDVMCRAMEKYLHVVDLGDVEPVETPYWSH